MGDIMNREHHILSYVSMSGTDLENGEISKSQAINKVYFLCKENGLKVSKKTIKELVEMEIKKEWKAQSNYFFYNPKA